MIPDGHHRHDFARVEKQRQRSLGDDGGLDALALMIDAGHGPRQARIVWRGADGEFLELGHGQTRCNRSVSRR